MSTDNSTSHGSRSTLLRNIVIGGAIIFVTQILDSLVVATLIQGISPVLVYQYILSALIGPVAFEGGIATMLLGLIVHLGISVSIAAIFLILVDRIAFMRRYVIPASLIYPVGVWIVLQFIVVPLSAAPPVPAPPLPFIIESFIEHILLVGLPLGLLVKRTDARKVEGGAGT